MSSWVVQYTVARDDFSNNSSALQVLTSCCYCSYVYVNLAVFQGT